MLAISAPTQQFFDLDGSPLDAGNLYFGVVGQNPETNPITVYWDAAGTQPAAQPIQTLNGYPSRAGSIGTLYAEGDYSISIKTRKGVLVRYIPTALEVSGNLGILADLASTSPGKGAELIGVLSSGPGSVSRTVDSKLEDIVSVFDFMTPAQIADVRSGALSVDVTAAIQAAINYVTNGTVFFPPGAYRVSNTLKIEYNNTNFRNCVNLTGTGQGSSLYWFGPDNIAMVWYEGTTINAGQFSTTIVEKLYFKNQNASNGLIGVRFGNNLSPFPVGGGGVANVTVRNNVFIDMAVGIQTEYQSNGINIEENIVRTFSAYGVYNIGSACMRVTKNYFEMGRPGSIAVYAEYTAITVSDNLIQSSETGVGGDILLKNVSGFEVAKNYLEHAYAGVAWSILLQNSNSGYIGSNVIQGFQGSDAVYADVNSYDVNIGANSYGFFGFPMASLVRADGFGGVNVLGNQDYVLAPVAISNASPAIVTSVFGVTGMQNGLAVYFTTTGTLPSGLTVGATYYVVNVSGATFQVSATPGGAGISTSSAGSGVHKCHIVLTSAFLGNGFGIVLTDGAAKFQSGRGVDFSKVSGAPGATNKVLTRYEEGTWSPTIAAASGTITSATASGTYTRIGRQVTLLGDVLINNAGTGLGALRISGLPFNVLGSVAAGSGRELALTGDTCSANYFNATTFELNQYANANMIVTNRRYTFCFIYNA